MKLVRSSLNERRFSGKPVKTQSGEVYYGGKYMGKKIEREEEEEHEEPDTEEILELKEQIRQLESERDEIHSEMEQELGNLFSKERELEQKGQSNKFFKGPSKEEFRKSVDKVEQKYGEILEDIESRIEELKKALRKLKGEEENPSYRDVFPK